MSAVNLQAVISGTQESRVEALRQILEYPLKQRDPEGSRFWFLRPGADEDEAEDTCPIAVGFYAELDGLTDGDIKQFLMADEQQREIYGHCPRCGRDEGFTIRRSQLNSANKSKWVTMLVRDAYYPKDEMKEQNPKMLLDDYVKFIRFGQWRIDQTKQGILAFITNHGYLDNSPFRGMRRSLEQTFDQIYEMDLHSNTKKKEVTPDGSKDENVFDIQ
ncbi:MAG: hypothetical protein MUF72_11820 [Elainella sp. Prado103]|jgi:hypothetical protein|nr:hypothetical protein [Elainella sp. Prado103]